MEAILEVLTKIKEELGGEECDVAIATNEFCGVSIRVRWRDGSDYNVERKYSRTEIENKIDDSILVDHFIDWAICKKHAATK